jgi:hypothetical protein
MKLCFIAAHEPTLRQREEVWKVGAPLLSHGMIWKDDVATFAGCSSTFRVQSVYWNQLKLILAESRKPAASQL